MAHLHLLHQSLSSLLLLRHQSPKDGDGTTPPFRYPISLRALTIDIQSPDQHMEMVNRSYRRLQANICLKEQAVFGSL